MGMRHGFPHYTRRKRVFKSLTGDMWEKLISRVLISGPPNTFKTSSLRTWPKPVHVISYPGEKGYASIPQEDGVFGYVWEEGVDSRESPRSVVSRVKELTIEILSGQRGEVKTFVGDGLHKLYEKFLAAVTLGASARGEEFEPRVYGRVHKMFRDYLDMVNQSPVPFVVFTSWSAREKDDPDAKGQDATYHEFPDLPGQMSRWIMGEFSIVLHSEVVYSLDPKKDATGWWRVKPGSKVWGAQMKIPLEILRKIPERIPQDWEKLYHYLITEEKANVQRV
jgi:hypothetical protein